MSEQDQQNQAAEADFFQEETAEPDPMGVAQAAKEKERKRRSRALTFLLAVLLLGGVLIYWLYEDLLFFMRSPTPTELGLSYEVKPEALDHNDYVRLSGIARDMCIRAEVSSEKVRFLYFLGPGMSSHILIESQAKEGEGCLGAEDRHFDGRLVDLARTGKYNSVIEYYRTHFPAAPRQGPVYLLQEGARPRTSWWYPLVFFVVLALWIINARTLLRVHRRRAAGAEQGGSR